MKWPLLKPQKNQKNNPSDSNAFLSPNLFSQEIFEQNDLSSSQRNFVLICKIASLLILGIFFITLAYYYISAKSFENSVNFLNKEAADLSLYVPVEKRINNLNKRLNLHKKLAPQRKNFVDKVSATLATISTDENLREFKYQDGVLQVTINRDDILTTTLLIEELLKEDYITEIAILNANLNTAEQYYTIGLEITYK